MMLRVLILIVFSVSLAVAQERNVEKMQHARRHDVAHDMIKKGGYFGAIEHLKDLKESHPGNMKYTYRLAEAYLHSRDYSTALALYEEVLAKDNNPRKLEHPAARYHRAECLQYLGRYGEARDEFEAYSGVKTRDKEAIALRKNAKVKMESCEYAISRKDLIHDIAVEHLGDGINSGYTEFAPRLKNDSTLIFASLQSDSVLTIEYGEIHYDHVKLYTSSYSTEMGHWSHPTEIPKINRKFESTANGSYSPDGKKFYFTRCVPNKQHEMKCKIYESPVDAGGNFGKPKKLHKHINTFGHNNTQPAMGLGDGKNAEKEVLYFVSDRKGGRGGSDIWYSMKDKNGNFTKPRNAGRGVNTPGNEVSPFYDYETGMLYFSSDLLPGFGGYDVYAVKGAAGRWDNPENLGRPVNSSYDDTYYTLGHNKFHAFVVSNRPGGMHLLSETCCDDIYSLVYSLPSVLTISVLDTLGRPLDVYPVVMETSLESSDEGFSTKTYFDYDTVKLKDEQYFLQMLGIKEKIEEFYYAENNKQWLVSVRVEGMPYAEAMLRTSSGALSLVRADSSTAELKVINQDKKLYHLVMGLIAPEPVYVKDTLPADTIVHATTLTEVYESITRKFDTKVDTMVSKMDLVPVKEKKKIETYDFNLNLRFEYNSAALAGNQLFTLDSLVTLLSSDNRLKFNVKTHTDDVGSDAYNMSLSQKRAAFIANYLVKKGVNKSRIKAEGFGESLPVAPNRFEDGTDNPEGRAKNRRTEIRIYYVEE